MSTKLFSIFTPTYNCESKIEKTIESVLSQDNNLFEYILVDGKSTDGTLDILEKYKSQISFLVEKDNGVYDAMNKGINLAKGKYLYFLGAGDCLEKDVLKKIENKIPEQGVFFIFFNLYRKDLNRIENYRNLNRFNITGNNIIHQAVLYHRDIFRILGKYNLKYKISADHCMNIKCFGSNRIHKLFISLIFANYEGNGISSKKNDEVFFKDKSKIILKNLGVYSFLYFRLRYFLSKIMDRLNYKKSIRQFIRKINIRL